VEVSGDLLDRQMRWQEGKEPELGGREADRQHDRSGRRAGPAVSLAFSLRGDFHWRRVPGYIIVQLIAASLAALFLHEVIKVSAKYGSNYPASGYSNWQAFLMEAALTLGL
jgi:aquaporin Z